MNVWHFSVNLEFDKVVVYRDLKWFLFVLGFNGVVEFWRSM